MPHVLIALTALAALVPLVAWLAYLGFSAWLLKTTGKSESLKDLAVAARAFPLAPRLPQALVRRREPPG